jgi:hypothetical protein
MALWPPGEIGLMSERYWLVHPNGGRQLIDPDRPHPFTAAGNSEFNCLLWLPPSESRAGDILLIDSTHFTTLFGGTDSLASLWRNLALMK